MCKIEYFSSEIKATSNTYLSASEIYLCPGKVLIGILYLTICNKKTYIDECSRIYVLNIISFIIPINIVILVATKWILHNISNEFFNPLAIECMFRYYSRKVKLYAQFFLKIDSYKGNKEHLNVPTLEKTKKNKTYTKVYPLRYASEFNGCYPSKKIPTFSLKFTSKCEFSQ